MILISACSRQSDLPFAINSFDISKDDKHILFSYYNNGKNVIYQIDSSGANLKPIISATDKSFFCVSYSPDNSKIVFLASHNTQPNTTSIFLASADGSNMQALNNAHGIITEAVFSKCGDSILYIKANEIKQYSPVGKTMPHGSDIYITDIYGKKTRQITNLDAYQLGNIADIDCEHLSVYWYADNGGGVHTFNKNKSEPLQRFVPTNNPRKDSSLYYALVYSKKLDEAIMLCPYEIYTLNVKTKAATVLIDNTKSTESHQMSQARFYNIQRRLMFLRDDDFKNLYNINLNGTNLQKLKLPERLYKLD